MNSIPIQCVILFADGVVSGYKLAQAPGAGPLSVVVDRIVCVHGGRDDPIDKLGRPGNAILQ